jgi:hypothetical protein
MIALVIGAIVYYVVLPSAKNYETTQKKVYSQLSEKYENMKTAINVYSLKVSVLSKKIEQMHSVLNSLRKKDMFYGELADLLDFARFDKNKWAQIVKNSVKNAKDNGLEVLKITNKTYDVKVKGKNKNMPHIVKRMDIGLKLRGKYKNFIYFLYNYENRKDLIRVNEMNITSPATFDVKFSIYGYDK